MLALVKDLEKVQSCESNRSSGNRSMGIKEGPKPETSLNENGAKFSYQTRVKE